MFDWKEETTYGIAEPWEVKVRRATNGFVMEYLQEIESDSEENEYITQEKVFEDNQKASTDEEAKLISLRNLFYEIQEYFGCFNSKHNKVNIEIRLINEEGKEIER